MRITIDVPEVDDIIRKCVLGSFFNEVTDSAKLLTELVEKSEHVDFRDNVSLKELTNGIVFYKFANDSVCELWEQIEGEAQFLQRYILDLGVK